MSGCTWKILIQLSHVWLLEFVDFHLLSESQGTIFSAFRSPCRPFWYHFGHQMGRRCTKEDPGGSQDGFSSIWDGFWVHHSGPCWVTFSYVQWFEVAKRMFGLQSCLNDFWMEHLLNSDAPASQEHGKYWFWLGLFFWLFLAGFCLVFSSHFLNKNFAGKVLV